MNVGNFSKHENKWGYSHRDKGNFLTSYVSQINVYAAKGFHQQSPVLKIAKSLIVHVFSLEMNGKQRNRGALCLQQYCTLQCQCES